MCQSARVLRWGGTTPTRDGMTLPETLTTPPGLSASWGDVSHMARGEFRAPPDLTVVVASRSDCSDLESYVIALSSRCRRLGAELLVVCSIATSTLAVLARRHQHVRFVSASTDATTAQLRAIGAREATGDVIVFANERDSNIDSWMESLRLFVCTGPVD
jgi:hypothetical protein